MAPMRHGAPGSMRWRRRFNAYAIDANHFGPMASRPQWCAARHSCRCALRSGFAAGGGAHFLEFGGMPDAQDPLGLTRAQLAADPDQARHCLNQTRKTVRQNTLAPTSTRLSRCLHLNTTFGLEIAVYAIPSDSGGDPSTANHPGAAS